MKKRLLRYLPSVAGIALGAAAGYAYYVYVGCSSGSCPITSSPYMSIIWGAVTGYLLVGVFTPKKNKKEI